MTTADAHYKDLLIQLLDYWEFMADAIDAGSTARAMQIQ